MTDTSDTFDWSADDSVAVREQPSLAVYSNRYGQVVIGRERSWDEEDDCFIHISNETVLTIVGAILRAAGMDDVQLYRQNGTACYDIDLPIRPEVAAMMAARPDIDWKAALEVTNEIEADTGSGAEPVQPKDRTAAERQRRHRANKERLAHDAVTETVTEDAADRDAPRLELVG